LAKLRFTKEKSMLTQRRPVALGRPVARSLDEVRAERDRELGG
jgi:hypothetical protein